MPVAARHTTWANVSQPPTPCSEAGNPFATPEPSRAPSRAPSPLPSSDKLSANGIGVDKLPPPLPAVARPGSIHSVRSSQSINSVRSERPSLNRDQSLSESSLDTVPKYQRPRLPPPKPSATPSQKWSRGPGFWRSFIAICVPLLLSALEGSITNTALPTISDALDLGRSFSWVATAFLLSSTIFQPLYGQLADIWGRKYPMLLAVTVFGIGSAICGWAKSGATLIAGRVIQGLGTGGIDLFAELILCDLVPLRKRGSYVAIKHAVFATGTTVGPLLGGVFAEHGWRWCFWINLPVCGLALILMFFWLRVGGGIKSRGVNVTEHLRRIDFIGTSMLTTSVVLILVALSTGGAPQSWDSAAILAPLVIGILGLIAFPIFEASKYCKNPIMPPHIFSNRTSATAFALTAIHGFVTYGVQFYLPPFFQAVKGSSPTKSGIEVLPCTLVIVVLAAIGGPLLTSFGKYKPIHQGGFAAMTLGFGLCIMLAKNTPVGAWVMFQLLIAVGSGIIVPTMLPAVLVELPDKSNGAAAGSWAFLRGTGSLFGVAIPGAIFNIRIASLLPTIASEVARNKLSRGQAYQRASSAFVGKFGDAVKLQIVGAFTQSLKAVWITFTVLAGIGLCLTVLERQVKMRKELDTQYGLKPSKSGSATPARPDIMAPLIEISAAEHEVDIEKVAARLGKL